MLFKLFIGRIVLFFFCVTSVIPPSAYPQNIPDFPAKILLLTPAFHPVMIKGMRIHPKNPLQFDFIIDTGDASTDIQGPAFKQEVTRMIKYFLASLTVPEKEMWVNLSPYEKNRIIAPGLGQTQLGSDMLAQDYILKQLTASLIYPDSITGKSFWKKVYAKAQEVFGTTNVPVNTFNKVWIVPDKAVVYVRGNAAYVVESHLKVMLEEDYLAMKKHDVRAAPTVSSNIVRQIILPELEKEVNGGGNFANLRQIYNAMILAVWFKVNFQKSLLGKAYDNKNKIKGVDAQDKDFKQKIYEQYIESFKKGVFNFIREEIGPDNQTIPRKYFSGGLVGLDAAMLHEMSGPVEPPGVLKIDGKRIEVNAAMLREGAEPAHPESSPPVKLITHDRPSLIVEFEQAGYSNYIMNGQVPAHIAVRKGFKSGPLSRPRSDYIVALPNERGVGFYWNLTSEKGEFTEKLNAVTPVVEGKNRGVDLEIDIEMTDKDSNETVITVNESNLRDILGIRSVLHWNEYLPDWEKDVSDHILPDIGGEFKKLINPEPSEHPLEPFKDGHIIPKYSVEKQADHSHLIRFDKTTFDGKNHYQLTYTVPPDFKVELIENKDKYGSLPSIKITGRGKLTLGVRGMTDFKPLRQVLIERIFNENALARMKIDPVFRKKAEYLSLLFYEEKVLAGSWLYLSFFGRDTVQGAALMWSSLSFEAKRMITRSILDRISDDGTVSVSDEDLGERNFYIQVLSGFHSLSDEGKDEPGKLGKMIRDVFESERQGTLKYGVLDSTFLFSGILKFLFEEMDDDQLRKFLNEENSRKSTNGQFEKNIVTILRHSNRLLEVTDFYTKAIKKLRGNYPAGWSMEKLMQLPEFKSPDFRAKEFEEGQAEELLKAIKADKGIKEAKYEFPDDTDAVAALNHLLHDTKFGEILDKEFKRKFSIAFYRKLSAVEIRSLLESNLIFGHLVPKGISTQLIGMMQGFKDANWRDSDWGNAGAIFVADINVSLALISIRNIENMVKRIGAIRKTEKPQEFEFDVQNLVQENKLTKLSDYMAEKDGIGFTQAKEAWATAIEHFKVHLTAAEIRDRYTKYFEDAKLPREEDKAKEEKRKAKNEFLLTLVIGQDEEGNDITLKQFLEDEKKTPTWLENGMTFTTIGLGKTVVHSDEIYSLLYDDLKSEELHRILNTIFAPYPIGLWNDDVGLFIAHAFMLEDQQIRSIFEKNEYHSQNVIWSKAMGELATGIIHQIRYAKKQPGREEDVLFLEGLLEKTARVDLNVGALREQEVWTFNPGENGRMVPTNFAIEGVGEGQPATQPHFFALSDLQAQEEYQKALIAVIEKDTREWKARLGEENFKRIFGEDDSKEYELHLNGRLIKLKGLFKVWEFLNDADAKYAVQNGLLPFVEELIRKHSSKPPLIISQLSYIKDVPGFKTFLKTILGPTEHNAAMAASSPGGIDLDASMMHLQAKGDGKNLGFFDAADSAMQVNGLTPVIIRVKLMNSPLFSD